MNKNLAAGFISCFQDQRSLGYWSQYYTLFLLPLIGLVLYAVGGVMPDWSAEDFENLMRKFKMRRSQDSSDTNGDDGGWMQDLMNFLKDFTQKFGKLFESGDLTSNGADVDPGDRKRRANFKTNLGKVMDIFEEDPEVDNKGLEQDFKKYISDLSRPLIKEYDEQLKQKLRDVSSKDGRNDLKKWLDGLRRDPAVQKELEGRVGGLPFGWGSDKKGRSSKKGSSWWPVGEVRGRGSEKSSDSEERSWWPKGEVNVEGPKKGRSKFEAEEKPWFPKSKVKVEGSKKRRKSADSEERSWWPKGEVKVEESKNRRKSPESEEKSWWPKGEVKVEGSKKGRSKFEVEGKPWLPKGKVKVEGSKKHRASAETEGRGWWPKGEVKVEDSEKGRKSPESEGKSWWPKGEVKIEGSKKRLKKTESEEKSWWPKAEVKVEGSKKSRAGSEKPRPKKEIDNLVDTIRENSNMVEQEIKQYIPKFVKLLEDELKQLTNALKTIPEITKGDLEDAMSQVLKERDSSSSSSDSGDFKIDVKKPKDPWLPLWKPMKPDDSSSEGETASPDRVTDDSSVSGEGKDEKRMKPKESERDSSSKAVKDIMRLKSIDDAEKKRLKGELKLPDRVKTSGTTKVEPTQDSKQENKFKFSPTSPRGEKYSSRVKEEPKTPAEKTDRKIKEPTSPRNEKYSGKIKIEPKIPVAEIKIKEEPVSSGESNETSKTKNEGADSRVKTEPEMPGAKDPLPARKRKGKPKDERLPEKTNEKKDVRESESDEDSINKKEIIHHINRFRRKHHADPLKESSSLSRKAQKWADYLADTGQLKKEEGQNVWDSESSSVPEAKDPCESWYDEVKWFHYGLEFVGNSGQFTQLVWRESKKVGVGVAEKDGRFVVVANFSPVGNVSGSFSENVHPPNP